MMKNKVYVVVMAFLVLILAWGCGNDPKKEADQQDPPKNVEKKILVAPIEYHDAMRMARTYHTEIDPKGKYGKFLWTDVRSMRAMLDTFDSLGQQYVRIYFGIAEDTVCKGNTRENRRYLTIFYEGAKLTGGKDSCIINYCKECFLEEDERVLTVKPYDVAQPCPPPKCQGFSRYYDLSTVKDSNTALKPREKDLQ